MSVSAWRRASVGLIFVGGATFAEAQPPKAGHRAPEIDLPTLNGGRFQLSKLRGHAVILSFWGTWCPPCRNEFPLLEAIHDQHFDAGLYVIGVNGRDQEESTRDVSRFVDAFAISFPIVLDNRGSVRRAYRIEGQPTTVFIDQKGVVRRVHVGLITRKELDEGVALILLPPS
ncbi:MAG: TlpA disulfide reductase family protein [Gemmatimonadaceae bacterium]